MSSSNEEHKPLLIDCFDFLVPCRRFSIKSNVTRDRQMPVVDEFVLRLIHVTERISLERLQRYFGFSRAETEIVLLDLQAHGLINITDDSISLTNASRALFRQVNEGDPPRLSSVEPWSDFVWFDLVSRNMAQATRYRALPNLPVLKERPEARALPEKFAREAFQANFGDYARRIRRHPEADRLALYSISDVEPTGYGYQALPADCGLTVHSSPELRLSFPTLSQNALQFRELTIAAADEWQRMDTAESAGGIEDYTSTTGDTRCREISAHMTDPALWTPLLQSNLEEGSRPLVGAAYLQGNIEAFNQTILSRLTDHDSLEISLLWLRPAGSRWGRTLRLSDALNQVREVCREGGRRQFKSTLVVPRAVAAKERSIYRRLFDEGCLAPVAHTSPTLEILLIPGVAAMILAHLPIPGGSLPIGLVTKSAPILDRLGRRFRAIEQFQILWKNSAPQDQASG